jgi:transcriptional regulator with XRE-family HTH domain
MIEPHPKRQAMGEFLRKHREGFVFSLGEKITGRRRTPGLRREEVAQLAGISAVWYTRLEQGKKISPSASALSRIAAVFQLTAAERVYLFHLAGRVDPENEGAPTNERIFGPLIEDFISAISVPAYLLDQYYSPIAWNKSAEQIFELWLAGPEKNLLWHVFLDPTAKEFLVNWELSARQLLAQFRIEYIKHIDDPQMIELVKGLNEGS